MTKFSFIAPNEDSFLEGLLVMLKQKGNEKISNMLSDSKCKIIDTGQWARYNGGTIWDANATTVNFAVPANKYSEAIKNIGVEEITIIKQVCNELMLQQVQD